MSKSTSYNNFDFLRLLMAYLVLFGHHHKLSGHSILMGIDLHNRVGLRVLAFFSISGYLIAQSWEREPLAWRFFAKRALRIMPGLIVATLVTVLLIGPLATTLPLRDYFVSSQTWLFLRRLGLNMQSTLPGVFVTNPGETFVNGSLWTMPIEFYLYLILLGFGVLGLLRRRSIILTGSFAFAVFVFAIYDAQYSAFSKRYLDLGAFFCYGICLYYFRDFWLARLKLILPILALISAILIAVRHQYAALFLLLPILVIWFGSSSTPFIRRAGRFGDFSFGIYLYGFPVQQTVIMFASNRLSIWSTLLISIVITLVLAILSWCFIEKPALRLKRYLGQTKTKRHIAMLDVKSLRQPEKLSYVSSLKNNAL